LYTVFEFHRAACHGCIPLANLNLVRLSLGGIIVEGHFNLQLKWMSGEEVGSLFLELWVCTENVNSSIKPQLSIKATFMIKLSTRQNTSTVM
jgi:hypothetical protein